MTYVIQRISDGRYLGASSWTFDIERALCFKTKELAKAKSKGYSKTKIVNYH